MKESNENKGFNYTYSAKEQDELKRIREKYIDRESHTEESAMDTLRRLDNNVTRKAQVVSLIFGIIGALLLGFGMSLVMTELSAILGRYEDMSMIIGIVIGIVGGALVCLAYPMYNLIAKRERKKIAPEIIRLTDELMK